MSQTKSYPIDNPTLVKEVTITAIAICVVFLGLTYVFPSTPTAYNDDEAHGDTELHEDEDSDDVISVSFVVNTDQDIYIMQEEVEADATVFDLTQQAAEENDFSFVYNESSVGVYVEELHGVANNQATDSYWTYTVNGELAEVGASEYELEDGDDVRWKYGPIDQPAELFE